MSIDNKFSETAIAIASLRALSYYETEKVRNSNDCFAEIFLPDEKQASLNNPELRGIIKKQIPKGMYEYVIARTKYFDKIYSDALNNNIEQIVLLGAGYDSRPYRFFNSIINTKIYELDAAPTQAYKLSCLKKNNIEIHQNICYTPVNFETDDPISALCSCGYEKEKQTLFLWEGVTFYLSNDTVTRMLSLLKDNSSCGSQICFDFQTVHNDSDLIKTGLKDEEIKFGIKSGEITKFINEHTYQVIEHLTADEMEKRFLTLQNGECIGRIAPIMNFILIEHK